MKITTISIFLVSIFAVSCNKKENTMDAVNHIMVKDSLEFYKKMYDEAAYFSIDKNENAQNQFAPQKIEDVMAKVVQDFSALIKQEAGISIFPVDTNGDPVKVNKMSVINHKWLIIDFYGEGIVGESLIKYDYKPDSVTEFQMLDTVLY